MTPRKVNLLPSVDYFGLGEVYHALQTLGFMLLILGFILIAIPFLVKLLPSLEKVPPIILWVYKHDGFYFATSPLLIIISIISIILFLLSRRI